MPFTPTPPFPKTPGNTIRAGDWNDLVAEVTRLDRDKVNRTGDALTGPLTIAGRLGIGTLQPNTALDIVSAENVQLKVTQTGNSNAARIVLNGSGNEFQLAVSAPGAPTPNVLTIGSAGVSNILSLTGTDGRLGVGILPDARLHVAGGAWDVGTTEGDFKIGDQNYRLKIGVAVGGGPGSGDVRIRAMGGTSRLMLGSENLDLIVIDPRPTPYNFPAGRVGVGITPDTRLHVAGGVWDVSTYEGDFKIGDGTYRLKIGVAVSGEGAGDVRIRAQGGTNRLALGTGPTDTMVVWSSRVGIGTWTPEVLLHVNGVAAKPNGGSWAAASDRKLKKNVQPLNGVLDRLLQLRGVSFEWRKPEEQGNLTGTQVGLIAQEVEEVFPEWVGADASGTKYVSISGFEALTIEALRELKASDDKIQELEDRIKVLESKGNPA